MTARQPGMKNREFLQMARFVMRRIELLWGKNFTKGGKLLPKIQFFPIYKLSTPHICAILDSCFNGRIIYHDKRQENLYRETFETELFCRWAGFTKRYNPDLSFL